MKKVVQNLGFVIRYEQLAPAVKGKQGARKRLSFYVPVAKSDYPEVLSQIMTKYGFVENSFLCDKSAGEIFAANARPREEEDAEANGKKAGKTLLELHVSAVGIVDLLEDVPDEELVSESASES